MSSEFLLDRKEKLRMVGWPVKYNKWEQDIYFKLLGCSNSSLQKPVALLYGEEWEAFKELTGCFEPPSESVAAVLDRYRASLSFTEDEVDILSLVCPVEVPLLLSDKFNLSSALKEKIFI